MIFHINFVSSFCLCLAGTIHNTLLIKLSWFLSHSIQICCQHHQSSARDKRQTKFETEQINRQYAGNHNRNCCRKSLEDIASLLDDHTHQKPTESLHCNDCPHKFVVSKQNAFFFNLISIIYVHANCANDNAECGKLEVPGPERCMCALEGLFKINI